MYWMKKFKNIDELYKITKISNDCFYTKLNKKDERVYIFKIEPVILLDLAENIKLNMVEKYKEFLRELTFNIQILVVSKKLNLDLYIKKHLTCNKNIPRDMYIGYVEELKKEIYEENIFESNIYIIVSETVQEKSKIEEITRVIYKLEELGCKVERVLKKEEIKEIIYNSLNKM